MNSAQILNALVSPGAEYRPVPFWFWNGALTEAEIDRQIGEMARQGIGGIAISPRQGMDVPYLSQRYFALFRHAALSAWRQGMFTWIYDEYPYPSGASGGEVLMRHPLTRQTQLVRHSCQSNGGTVCLPLGEGVVLDAKAIPLDAQGRACWEGAVDLLSCVGVVPTETVFQECSGLTVYNEKRYFTHGPQMELLASLPAGHWRFDACVQQPIEDYKYYNGYIDPCDPEATAAFMQTTHERYKAAVGDLFGTVIRGVFTDETGLLRMPPWSRLLPAEYERRYAEPLAPQLCRLFDETAPENAALRARYYHTLHEMLRENYHHPIARWCRENGLAYIAEVPGMRMTTQRYSDVPGGDFNHEKIGVPLDTIHDLHTTNYRHNPTAIASLARQKGAPRALVESFHSIGWSMTLQDAKWGIDYLTACGINLFNLHAFSYSTAGLRKYDAPPSQFFQNPYWDHYRLFADYAARNALISANTASLHDVAVLEPTTTLWTLFTNPFDDYAYGGSSGAECAEHERIRDCWRSVRKALFHAQIGFDHLDAEMLAAASISDGALRIGNAVYHALIVTHSLVIEEDALRAIERFRACGGLVCVAGSAPSHLPDGSALPLPFPSSKSAGTLQELCQCLLERLPQPMRFDPGKEGATSCVSCLRETDCGEPWLFAANQQDSHIEGMIQLAKGYGGVECIGCDGRAPLTLRSDSDGRVHVRLAPYEALWFRALRAPVAPAVEGETFHVPVDGRWPFHLAGGNLLRMEEARVRMQGGDWIRTRLRPYGLLREALGELEAGSWRTSDGFGLPKRIYLQYPYTYLVSLEFQARFCPQDLELVLEEANLQGEAQIALNGIPLAQRGVQDGLLVFPLGHAVQEGTNELLFTITVYHDWDGLLDAVFLRGSFSVAPHRTLEAPVSRGTFSTAYPQGAPFYSGEITWDVCFDAPDAANAAWLALQTDQPLQDCIDLTLNGHPLGPCAFSPYRWAIEPQWLRSHGNRLVLRIKNTLVHQYEGRYFDPRLHRLIRMEEG